MKLKDKITSYEDFMKVPGAGNYVYGDADTNVHFQCSFNVYQPRRIDNKKYRPNGEHHQSSTHPKKNWWWVREYMRYQQDSTGYGDVLALMWTQGYHSLWAPKPNADDPMKIDFFPDDVAGQADRPVTTTMAKFLRRTSPLYTDEYIRDIDAAYRASMSNEVEIITDPAAFREAYVTGPSSCMSHYYHLHDGGPERESRGTYATYKGNHPVDAYLGIDGIGLAVLRDGHGKVNARCVVYTNPADAKDKRMIRVYGDSSLEGRLKRRGYNYRPLEGLALRRIVMQTINAEADFFQYIAPFLDGTQGQHSGEDKFRYVIHVKGEDKLRIVPQMSARAILAEARKLDPDGPLTRTDSEHVVASPGAGGTVSLYSVPASAITYKCPVSGVTVDLTREAVSGTISVWLDGVVQQALDTSAVRDRFSVQAMDCATPGYAVLYESASAPPVFLANPRGVPLGRKPEFYVDNSFNRYRLGYRRMNPTYYPGQTAWIKTQPINRYDEETDPRVWGGALPSERLIEDTVRSEDGEQRTYLVKQADMFEYLTNTSVNPDIPNIQTRRSHISLKAGMALTRVHSTTRGVELWVDNTVKVRKTDTGRNVVVGYHDVSELYDGSITFNRNVSSFRWLNFTTGAKLRTQSSTNIDVSIDSAFFERAVDWFRYRLTEVSELFGRRRPSTQWEAAIIKLVLHNTGFRIRGEGSTVRLTMDRYSDIHSREFDPVRFMASMRTIMANEELSSYEKREARDLVRLIRGVRKMYASLYEHDDFTYPDDRVPRPTEFADLSLPDDPDTTLPIYSAPQPATSMETLAQAAGAAPAAPTPPPRITLGPAGWTAITASTTNIVTNNVVIAGRIVSLPVTPAEWQAQAAMAEAMAATVQVVPGDWEPEHPVPAHLGEGNDA